MEKSLIYSQIPKIMADVEAIPKNRKNPQQGYSFRGIDDLYYALQGVLAKHGVFSVPKVILERTEDRQTKSGSHLIYRILTIEYTFYAADGSNITATVIGEGMDSGDKASNKAMSVAQKYALLQIFCIPTEEHKDPEMDSPEESRPIVKKEEIFDPKDAIMVGRLTKWCFEHDIKDEKHIREIIKRMAGRTPYAIQTVVTQLENELKNYNEGP